MSLQRDTRPNYVGRWAAASTEHPQGAFRNRVNPGDGSYLEEDWLNDWDGFFGSLLSSATLDNPSGVAPNGSVDEVGASQYFNQLLDIIRSINTAVQPGDHIGSQNDLTSRGFTVTNGIPLLARGTKANTNAWAGAGTISNTGALRGIAVNSTNGDVWVIDSIDGVYHSPGGTDPFALVAGWTGGAPRGVAVDSLNNDLFVCDDNGEVFRLPGGTGSFLTLGSIGTGDSVDITVNPYTKDLWVVDNNINDIDLFTLQGGLSTNSWVPQGSVNLASAATATGLDINPNDRLLYISDNTRGLYAYSEALNTVTSLGRHLAGQGASGIAVDANANDVLIARTEVWRMIEGLGQPERINSNNYPGTDLEKIAINSVNGDIWGMDASNSTIYQIAGDTVVNPVRLWGKT